MFVRVQDLGEVGGHGVRILSDVDLKTDKWTLLRRSGERCPDVTSQRKSTFENGSLSVLFFFLFFLAVGHESEQHALEMNQLCLHLLCVQSYKKLLFHDAEFEFRLNYPPARNLPQLYTGRETGSGCAKALYRLQREQQVQQMSFSKAIF